MILKTIVILITLGFIYVCVKLLLKSNRTLDQLQGSPPGFVDDMDLPRSQLIKTIEKLREQNKTLQNKITELEKEK